MVAMLSFLVNEGAKVAGKIIFQIIRLKNKGVFWKKNVFLMDL
jgi:hypothetical protein